MTHPPTGVECMWLRCRAMDLTRGTSYFGTARLSLDGALREGQRQPGGSFVSWCGEDEALRFGED